MNAELLIIICFSMLVTSVAIMLSVILTYARVDHRQFDMFADLEARLR